MGLWHTDGSPNLGQRTRPYNNQQQKKRICKIVDFAVPIDHRIKLKECEKKYKYLDLARELKKLWNMQGTIIPIVIGAFGTVTKELLKGLEELELVEEWRQSKQQHYWEQPEYWEESWRLQENCCHSNSSERPSADADVNNTNGDSNNNNNNNNNIPADQRIKLKECEKKDKNLDLARN